MIPKDIFLYSPYDSLYNGVNVLNEDLFFSSLFCEHDKLLMLLEDFKKYLSSESERGKPIVILSGYSGCGKTTFINWLKRDLIKENNFFKVISLTNELYSIGSNDQILVSAIRKDLTAKLLSLRALTLITENLSEYIGIFTEVIKTPSIKDAPELVKQISKSKIVEIQELYHELKFGDKTKTDKIIAINRFIQNDCFEFRDLLFIYMLEHILEFQERENKYKEYIFCFDNLDEMKYEYISKQMWDDISQVWHALTILCKSDEGKINFPFSSKLHLILVFRESNISLSNLDNPQTYDRLYPKIQNRRVILSGEVDNILMKRLLFIEKYLPQYDENSLLVKLFKYLRQDKKFTKRFLLPFFNYDYRKLFIAIDQLTERDDEIKNAFFIQQQDMERIINLSKYEPYRNLLRGIIMQPIIFSACRDQLKNLITNKEIGCRLSRLILTVLYNLSYSDGLPSDQTQKDEIEPGLIPLSSIYKYFAKNYSVDYFLENLFKCYQFHNERWAHLISLYNVKIAPDSKPRFRKKTKEILLKIAEDPNSYEFDPNNESFVHFNASAYAYLRYIITHFEYYSYLSVSKLDSGEYFPLVNLAYKIESQSDGILIFSFEKRIKDILQIVREYKINIDKSYGKNFSHMSPQKYTKSEFSFGDESVKRFYMTRVITTHITYLDDFRRYLFESNEFAVFCKSKVDKGISILKGKKEINLFLIGAVSEYLSILEIGIMDPTIFALLQDLKEKVIVARNAASKDLLIGISLSIDN